MAVWVTLLRVVTSIAQIGMILSPGPDILNVHKHKTTGEMAALPLVAMIVNNHLWTLYGYLTDSIFPLMVTQLFGELRSCLINQSDDQVGETLGYVGLVVNIGMYASPLGTIRHVVRSGSAASLPINISVTMVFSTTLWVSISIVDNDMIIMSINIVGIMLSITQIAVYMRFRPNRSAIAQEEACTLADKQLSIVVSPKDETTKSPIYQPVATPIEKALA
ncbi:hypothetical protein PF010_g27601 [Phytophthora fragariae]|uniref:Sugar transporter SWEET1 n=1 Tax=Phytophthora fragariae TaxID=53985 RepID=A0A6A3Q2U4_9STRA|nr:hypothetical protein PF003_g26665 [Phytophthora fragariae]KAE8920998.1 hypothetical protein PF009_g28716 [Phytophthora fragariae]KAE9067095.1 hypothetical protein PF010_g27601 [Phytophthora fragariae]KAE9067644.1 hypothetical protein PF007_g27993 [Phytophthora fragariae]KAE9173076.1 hypothetical protein PF004_g27084 [Phytophthora fragariae]